MKLSREQARAYVRVTNILLLLIFALMLVGGIAALVVSGERWPSTVIWAGAVAIVVSTHVRFAALTVLYRRAGNRVMSNFTLGIAVVLFLAILTKWLR